MLFIIVVALNVLATLINATVCVWFTSKKKQYKYDDLLCDTAFIVSIVALAADVAYLIVG